ncbi:hypothetical protein Unana1_07017 [Umbelopsis nana]
MASSSDAPSYQLAARDIDDEITEQLIEDDTPIEDDEDEEATSSLNHIDEDDAKEIVEEIDIWANVDAEDDGSDEAEEDLVDDEEEDTAEDGDDEHDHEMDEEDEEEEEDVDEEEEEFDEDDEEDDTFDQEAEELASDRDQAQSEVEEELRWSEEHITESDAPTVPDHAIQNPKQVYTQPPPMWEEPLVKLDAEKGHADAELETKEQENSLMDLGGDDQDIPPPDHHWNPQDHSATVPPLAKGAHSNEIQEPCHSRSTLVWLGFAACCIVLAYRAHAKIKSLDNDSQHSVLPFHQNDIKQPVTSSPVHEPAIVIDTSRLHTASGRGHHRKTSSVSSHVTPRSSRPSSGIDNSWSGDWKEGKEW